MRGHEGKRTTRRMMSKHQRGNVKADANCKAVKRGARSKVRLLLPRRKSWRLCYDRRSGDGGVLRKELRDKTRTERLVGYFRDTRGWGEELEADRWLYSCGIVRRHRPKHMFEIIATQGVRECIWVIRRHCFQIKGYFCAQNDSFYIFYYIFSHNYPLDSVTAKSFFNACKSDFLQTN